MRRHLRLVLNVSFDGQSRHDPASPPYYEDDELLGVVMGELEAVVHNEDRPRTTLIASRIFTNPDDEWDPPTASQLRTGLDEDDCGCLVARNMAGETVINEVCPEHTTDC